MRIKVNPFPAVYFNAMCQKHACPINLHVEESKSYGKEDVVGGQISTLCCQKGGVPSKAECLGHWEMYISTGGDITITQ